MLNKILVNYGPADIIFMLVIFLGDILLNLLFHCSKDVHPFICRDAIVEQLILIDSGQYQLVIIKFNLVNLFTHPSVKVAIVTDLVVTTGLAIQFNLGKVIALHKVSNCIFDLFL